MGKGRARNQKMRDMIINSFLNGPIFKNNKAIQTKFKVFVNFDEQSRVLSGHCVCCGEWHNLLFGLVIAQDSWSSSSFSILFLYNYLHVNLFYFVHGLIKDFT